MEVQETLYSIQRSLIHLLPEGILVFGILLLVIISFFSKEKSIAPVLTLAISLVTLVFDVLQSGESLTLFSNWLFLSDFAVFFKALASISAFLGIILYLLQKGERKYTDEFCLLILSITLGCHLLVMSNNLLMVFISIEMISLSSYLLTGFLQDKKSSEGSLKYFLFGCVASAVMLYGITLLYGFTGSLNFTDLEFAKGLDSSNSVLITLGLSFLLAGILFKISAAPLHIWAPDVYESAPTSFVAFLSVAPKLAAIGFLTRLVLKLNQLQIPFFDWQLVLAVIIITTITIGNFAALNQKNVKRLMAYSSIAQSGFLLIGLCSLVPTGIHFMLFYCAIFLIMNFLVFTYIVYFEKRGMHTIESYSGIGKHTIVASVFLLIGFISLTGLPPTAGFTGKLFVFSSLWESFELTGNKILLWVMIFGLLNTVVSLFYYLRIPYFSFLKTTENAEKQNFITAENLLGAVMVLMLLLFFFNPELLMGWINKVNFVF